MGKRMVGTGKRNCKKCNTIFPLTKKYFYRSSKDVGGFRYVCKNCVDRIVAEHKKMKNTYNGNVYFFYGNGFVKIGHSENIYERLKQAKIYCPFELKCLHLYHSDNPKEEEIRLHKLFAKYHTIGEWFKIDESEILKLL